MSGTFVEFIQEIKAANIKEDKYKKLRWVILEVIKYRNTKKVIATGFKQNNINPTNTIPLVDRQILLPI